MYGPAFEADLKAFSLWQPVITDRPLQQEGFLFAYELETLRRFLYHPYRLLVDNLTCLFEGDRGAGKSAALKILFTLSLSLAIAEFKSDGVREYLRGRTFSRKSSKNDVKPNAPYTPEFELTAKLMKQEVITLGYGSGLNLLSIFHQETDIIEFIMAAIEMGLGRAPGPDVTNVIMVAVNRMMRTVAPHKIAIGVLNNILDELTFEDSEDYHKNYKESVAKKFDLDAGGLKLAVRQVKPDHIQLASELRFYEAKHLAMTTLHQILEGDYGRAFNGTADLYEILSRRVGHIDLEALPPKGQALFEMALLRAQSNAIIAGKQDIGGGRNLLKTIAHFNASDEEGIAIKELPHLRALALWMIRQRSFPTADFRALQFGSQLLQAGEYQSEARGLALEIEQGFGYRFIFRQQNNETTLNRYRELNLPEPFVQLIPELKTGQVIIWTKQQSPVVVRIIVPKTLYPVIQSDAAREITDPVDSEQEANEIHERFARLRPGGTLYKQKVG